jgi:hypothetical protein
LAEERRDWWRREMIGGGEKRFVEGRNDWQRNEVIGGARSVGEQFQSHLREVGNGLGSAGFIGM